MTTLPESDSWKFKKRSRNCPCRVRLGLLEREKKIICLQNKSSPQIVSSLFIAKPCVFSLIYLINHNNYTIHLFRVPFFFLFFWFALGVKTGRDRRTGRKRFQIGSKATRANGTCHIPASPEAPLKIIRPSLCIL